MGMTKNRDIEKFCQYFQDLVIEGRAVKVLSEPSSYSADTIVQRSQKFNLRLKVSSSLDIAIKEIASLNINKECIIVITGSLFLISDFYKLQ